LQRCADTHHQTDMRALEERVINVNELKVIDARFLLC
jgi:hypothetical protein